MTPQELKNSILQLAIQGKLVEQRPEEGTAEELYRQIQAEKKRLIKEEKIKNSKKIEPISDDIIPFDIPNSWIWIRFGNLVNYAMGKTPPRAEPEWWGGAIPWVSIADMPESGHICETKECVTSTAIVQKFGSKVSPAGTLLMSFKLTVGRVSILDVDAVHNEAIISIHPLVDDGSIEKMYLFYVLPFVSQFGESKNAIKGKTLNDTSICNLLLPLPPLAEQKRIVAKIEELLPYFDRYEQAWSRLDEFNKRFPTDMQNSLLQWAIQGKLVEQRVEEGTAEGVYPEIQGEPPFDIPQNWKWVRLSDIIVEKPSNGLSPKGVNYETKVKNLTLTATTSGKFKPDAFKYVDIDLEPDSKYWLKNGDLLIQRSNSRELVGTSCVYTGKDNEYIYPDLMMKLRIKDGISISYVDYVLKAPLSRFYFSKNASGTSESMPKINQRIVSDTPIPLPPLAEQKRIVAKLEQLLPLCGRLK